MHGKKTVLDKIHGTYEEKFAQARLLYLYMLSHPGKKLNFMGSELGMFREWDEARELDWALLKMPAHDSFRRYMAELNTLYKKTPALWKLDCTYDGFKWVDSVSDNPCVFAYIRTDGKNRCLTILNFSDQEAVIHTGIQKGYLLLDTSWDIYGGTRRKSHRRSIAGTIPPFGGLLCKINE